MSARSRLLVLVALVLAVLFGAEPAWARVWVSSAEATRSPATSSSPPSARSRAQARGGEPVQARPLPGLRTASTDLGETARGTRAERGHQTYTYTPYGELASVELRHGSSPGTLEARFDYEPAGYPRDALGRVTCVTETRPGASPEVTSTRYEYDLRDRLSKVYAGPGDCAAATLAAEYGYDPNGNRTTETLPGTGTTISTYDAQDRLTDAGLAHYDYTRAGELVAKTVGGERTEYHYDGFGSLRKVVKLAGQLGETTIDYTIDALGRRVGKSKGGVVERRWLYGTGMLPVAELGSDGLTSRSASGRATS